MQKNLDAMNFTSDIDLKIKHIGKKFGSHLSISVTKRCPLKCAHCIVNSLPSKDRNLDISDKIVESILNNLNAITPLVKQLTFTGGEPFLRKDILKKISKEAVIYGIKCSVVTSAYWSTSFKKALHILESLPDIQHLTISNDIYHEEYLPRSNVRNAVSAANRLNKTVSIGVCQLSSPTKHQVSFLDEIKKEFGDIIHIQEIVGFGRAKELNLNLTRVNHTPVFPCLSRGLHITQRGNVIPCCSTLRDDIEEAHPLNLGNINNHHLNFIIQKSKINVLLNLIRLWGFPKIMEKLLSENPIKYRKLNFIEESQCSLCAILMHDDETVRILSNWVNDLDLIASVAVGSWQDLNNKEPMKDMIRKKDEIFSFINE